MTLMLVCCLGIVWALVAAVVVSLCVMTSRQERDQDTIEFAPVEVGGVLPTA